MHVEARAIARWWAGSSAGRICVQLLLAVVLVWSSGSPAGAAETERAPATAAGRGPSVPSTEAAPTEASTAAVSEEAGLPEPAAPILDPLATWSRGGDILERAESTRLAALQLGLSGFDPSARSLLLPPQEADSAERARAAVAVAPDLPLARAALARSLLLDDHDVFGALRAAVQTIQSLLRHREARLWLEATGFTVLGNALFFGALLFLVVLCAPKFRAAAHDLGDRIGRVLPLFARAGLLGVLLLVPPLLGQGLLGLGLSLFALAICYGSRAEQRGAWAAAVLLVLGLEIGSLGAARALVALDPDAVSAALNAVSRGVPSRLDHLRLEHASGYDALAARGLAVEARRQGRLREAASRYDGLLASEHADTAVANNAANVALALGDLDRAIALYEQVVDVAPSAVALYNLSYGYGRTIRPRAQDLTLQRLQQQDPSLAFELLQLQSKLPDGFTLDLPLPATALERRADWAEASEAVASDLRRPLAPGLLGAPLAAALALLGTAAFAHGISRRVRPSRDCSRCGGRVCPRCDGGSAAGQGLCASCRNLFERPETADPERRERRLLELKARQDRVTRGRRVVSWLVPGAAGILVGRPWLGLLGAVSFGFVLAHPALSRANVVDPLAAGGAGDLAFGGVQALALCVYLVGLLFALRSQPEART
jgi:tetratricopeptide (TPR) repeat protein